MSSPENPYRRRGIRPEKITLCESVFEYVIAQRDGKTAIYRSTDSYMRIGETKKIHSDLALHKKMERTGFPVAELLAEGEYNGQAYFIEASLGDKHLGNVFAEDVEKNGHIDEIAFEQFLAVTEEFAHAQLTTSSETRDYGEFSHGVLLEELCRELPEHQTRLDNRFAQVRERTAQLPFVLTHGDFNPNNLYPSGVIDLEDSFYAPYGYDIVSAISHINYFPDSKDYEFYAKYRFDPEQKKQYFERLDAVSTEAGLLPLSQFEEDFEFCRAVWLAARLPHVPNLQKFRYEMLIDKFLED